MDDRNNKLQADEVNDDEQYAWWACDIIALANIAHPGHYLVVFVCVRACVKLSYYRGQLLRYQKKKGEGIGESAVAKAPKNKENKWETIIDDKLKPSMASTPTNKK